MTTTVLEKIFEHETHPIGCYCFKCGVKNVKTILTENGEEFLCINNHRSPRVYLFDDKSVSSIEDGKLVHAVVGAIIKKNINDEDFLLLFLRRKFPFLYTIPAGHLENEHDLIGEMKREITEETALTILKCTQLWQTPLRLFDPCRRGADFHDWYVFEAKCYGEPQLSNEGKQIGWFSKDEVKKLAQQKLLTLPVEFILKKYFGGDL